MTTLKLNYLAGYKCKMILLVLGLLSFVLATPDWQVNPAEFENTLNMVIRVELNGQSLTEDEDILAAFVDDECRGISFPFSFNDDFIFLMTVYANTNGETVTFQIYHLETDQIVNLEETILFIENDVHGQVDDPFVLHGSILIPGDMNADNSVDILDVVELVFVILGEIQASEHHLAVGDMNGDNSLDIIDVVVILDLILYGDLSCILLHNFPRMCVNSLVFINQA